MRRKFHNYLIGYIHIELAEVWTDEGKLYLFVAIDRVSKFALAARQNEASSRHMNCVPDCTPGSPAVKDGRSPTHAHERFFDDHAIET